MSSLTHFDAQGQAHMVDVGAKPATHRIAVAEGRITMQPETLAIIQSGTAKKGDVLGIARIAGIMAAKKTSDLIPLCHPLALTRVAVEFDLLSDVSSVRCVATVETVGPTGVEMEALTAVQVALLTVYDMCKAVDKSMVMEGVKVMKKKGAPPPPPPPPSLTFFPLTLSPQSSIHGAVGAVQRYRFVAFGVKQCGKAFSD